MSVDSVKDFKPEVSKPVEKWSALKVKIQQIFNKRDDQSPQKTLQALSSLEITRESQEISPTTITQPKKLTNTTSQDQVEVDKIREDIRNFPVTQEELPKSTDSGNQISTVDVDSTTLNSGVIDKIKDTYEKKQREKIEKYKELILSDFNYSKPDEDRLRKEKPPSIVKQFGRIVLDTRAAKIIFPRLHENSHFQQELEAENTAAVEYYGERNLSIKAERQAEEVERKQREIVEESRRELEKAAETQQEQQKFEQDFLQGMENSQKEKVTRRKKERVQEIIERAFNERLTKLEDIDLTSSMEGSGVVKRQIEYYDDKLDEKSYTIYDMKGYQFRFLQHGINYKQDPYRTPGDTSVYRGYQTSKDLLDNPSLWAKSRDSVGKLGGEKSNDTKSNVICTSYINTETSVHFKDWGNNLISYGFDSVLPGSILDIAGGDLRTDAYLNDKEMVALRDPLYTPERLEQSSDFYNEVVLRRYNSDEKPQLPNFLIVKDMNQMTEESKKIIRRHAIYFNIPIINIETQYYKSKK